MNRDRNIYKIMEFCLFLHQILINNRFFSLTSSYILFNRVGNVFMNKKEDGENSVIIKLISSVDLWKLEGLCIF